MDPIDLTSEEIAEKEKKAADKAEKAAAKAEKAAEAAYKARIKELEDELAASKASATSSNAVGVDSSKNAVASKKNVAEEMVSVRLFKDNHDYKDDLFVCVNGQRYQIQRGVDVEVPKYIKEAIDASEQQDRCTATMIQMIVSDAKGKDAI